MKTRAAIVRIFTIAAFLAGLAGAVLGGSIASIGRGPRGVDLFF